MRPSGERYNFSDVKIVFIQANTNLIVAKDSRLLYK